MVVLGFSNFPLPSLAAEPPSTQLSFNGHRGASQENAFPLSPLCPFVAKMFDVQTFSLQSFSLSAFVLLGLLVPMTATAGEPQHWGVNGHPLNQAAYLDVSLEAQLDLVAELGASWYRCDVDAPVFQGDPARFDALV